MLRFIKNNKFQILRFILVGLLSTGLNFLVYKTIYIFSSNIIFSAIFGYFVGLLNSFLFTSKWVFSNYKSIRVDKAFLLFTLIYVLGGIEMTITINVIYKITEQHNIAWLFGAGLAASNNYLLSKYFIFKT